MAKRGLPSDVELQVLTVLWDRGPSTVSQVSKVLPDRKKRAYTTVLSLLQGLERKALIHHEAQGRTHIYHASVSRDHVLQPLMKRMLRLVFGGRASQAMQYLLNDEQLSDGELEQMRQVIARYQQQKETKE